MNKYPIQPIYTLKEIKTILNKRTSHSAAKFLEASGIPTHLVGNKYLIYLTDIQIHAPQFYSSLLEANNIQQFQLEESQPEFHKEQFRSAFFSGE